MDDFDVEAMLDAPFKKQDDRSESRSPETQPRKKIERVYGSQKSPDKEYSPKEYRSVKRVSRHEQSYSPPEKRDRDSVSRERDYGPQERDFESRERGYEKHNREYDSRDKVYKKRFRYESGDKDYERPDREYEPREKDYEKRDREYEPRDRDYGKRDREYEPRDKDYEKQGREYEPRDKDYEKQGREYEPRDKDYEKRDTEHEPRDKEYAKRDREYEPRDKDYEKQDRDYEPRDKDYEKRDRDYESREKDYEKEDKDYKSHDKDFESRDRQYESREKEYVKREKDYEPRGYDVREKQYEHRSRKSYPDYHSRERRHYSPPDRRRSFRGSYRGGGSFRRGGFFGGSKDYRRFPRSRSRSRERKPYSRPKGHSPSPKKKEIKNDDSSNEFDKPSRLHRNMELSAEERDMRTVFCMQLSQRVRARDLEEFFLPVGKVQDVRIIMDNKTRRSKGIAYVEFQETYSVSLAIGYSGKKLLGIPIIVQMTQAEKNRAAASLLSAQRGVHGPMRLYVGSLHFNITEEMLTGIFEPFGKIDRIELMKDTETGRSKGYGFVTFHEAESAKKALEQLNGFELAGRPMKVGTVTDRTDILQGPTGLDTEEMDRAGIDLGATGRLQLMAKLAEGTGFELPRAAVKALQLTSQATAPPMPSTANDPTVSIATQCFILSNMFDPAKEAAPNWEEDIRNDVIDECRNHGGALHVYVDKNSADGNVYVKCPNLTAAAASVTALHGRYFAGRVIVAAYVPVLNYNMLFPESVNVISVL